MKYFGDKYSLDQHLKKMNEAEAKFLRLKTRKFYI